MKNNNTVGIITGLAYLEEQLTKRTHSFHSSVKWFKRRFYVSTMSTVFLSAFITILAGWKPSLNVFGMETNNIILILGATITIVSAWGAFFSPKQSWLIYSATLNRLRALQTKIEYMKKAEDEKLCDPDYVKIIYKKYQKILDKHNKAWSELRASHNKTIHSFNRT